MLDRIDDRFALLADGDRLAEARQRSLAAAVQWSYQLLDEPERRVFRAVSAFPGPFTLDGAEAVAGPAPAGPCCGWWTARCWSRRGSIRTAGPGTLMLETLRAYGAGLLAEAGEDGAAAAALAGYAAAGGRGGRAGLQTSAGELAGRPAA